MIRQTPACTDTRPPSFRQNWCAFAGSDRADARLSHVLALRVKLDRFAAFAWQGWDRCANGRIIPGDERLRNICTGRLCAAARARRGTAGKRATVPAATEGFPLGSVYHPADAGRSGLSF